MNAGAGRLASGLAIIWGGCWFDDDGPCDRGGSVCALLLLSRGCSRRPSSMELSVELGGDDGCE